MSDQPSTKHKCPFTITVPIDNLQNGQTKISPDHTFDGLIWRVHVSRTQHHDPSMYWLNGSIDCDGDGSSEMWRTEAKMYIGYKTMNGLVDQYVEEFHSFASWRRDGNNCNLTPWPTNYYNVHTENIPIEAIVVVETESESFTRRPIVDPNSSIHDVILVLEGQKIPMSKQDLASQSNYFNSLFFRGYKESEQKEIEIKDADPEDFKELLNIMYGNSTEKITVESATRYLIMADIFDLQIVKEQVENSLLSTDFISIHRKFLIAEEHKLKILKSDILHLYKNKENLLALKKSPEFAEFTDSMKDLLFENARNLLE